MFGLLESMFDINTEGEIILLGHVLGRVNNCGCTTWGHI